MMLLKMEFTSRVPEGTKPNRTPWLIAMAVTEPPWHQILDQLHGWQHISQIRSRKELQIGGYTWWSM
jgi:hypothetical protein